MTMTPQEMYDRLIETVKSYNPSAGFDQIRAAYEYAAAHHAGQNRKDGSPFITHPLAVAQIVAEELHLDTESIVAALLHDTIEDTDATHEEISKLFSPTVADLVEGVHHGDTQLEYVPACGVAAKYHQSRGGAGLFPVGGQRPDTPVGAGIGDAAV